MPAFERILFSHLLCGLLLQETKLCEELQVIARLIRCLDGARCAVSMLTFVSGLWGVRRALLYVICGAP